MSDTAAVSARQEPTAGFEAYLSGVGFLGHFPSKDEAKLAILVARKNRKGDAAVFDPDHRMVAYLIDGLWLGNRLFER